MERILFVDACMRGATVSRTHQLCRHFLEKYMPHHPEAQVIHRDLCREPLPLLTGELSNQREHWMEDEPDHPLLNPAKEMAGADLILIGAPYWDLLFPAALKAYLEWASCRGITFRYTEEGQQIGLSRARTLVYCTTGGGPVAGQNHGYGYIKALAAMFGIPETHCVAAEGLDIWGNDVPAILERAEGELAKLAARL